MKNITVLLLCLWCSICSFAQTTYTVNSLAPLEEQPKIVDEEAIANKQSAISFQLLGGLIIINTEIDGLAASCIFDTGAPSIIINKEEDLIAHDDDFGVGVTGKTKMNNMMVHSFEMGDLKMTNMQAIEIDISHIEKMKNHAIQGIIGVDAYRTQEVLIDYKKEEIQFLPRKQQKQIGTKTKIATIPFFMEDQLPVIRVKIGKKHFYFGVDTGAEVNVLDARCMKKLKKCIIKMGDDQLMTSVCQNKNWVKTTIIDKFKIRKQTFYNGNFAILDLSEFNKSNGALKLDGILGFPFLKENLVSFDFRRSRLNFWKEYNTNIKELELDDLVERVVMNEK